MLTRSALYFILINLIIGIPCSALTLTVDDDAPADYSTIQAAINAAANGDTIIVEEGVYTGPGNRDLDFAGKRITVKSRIPDNPQVVAATIIDCQATPASPHRGFYFHNNETAQSVLDGLTIRNGYAPTQDMSPYLGPDDYPDTFDEGFPAYGTSWSIGGAIFCVGADPTIKRCRLVQNRAWYGAGIAFVDSVTALSNCLILDNEAVNAGAGIYCKNCRPLLLQISYCTVFNNRLTGDETTGNPWFIHGVGLHSYDSKINITNSILWDESGTKAEIGLFLVDSTLNVSYCLVRGTKFQPNDSFWGLAFHPAGDSNMNWGLENIGLLPFEPKLRTDGHLLSDSPCINAGLGFPSLQDTDIDGEARRTGLRVDIGCDEFLDTDGDKMPDWWEKKYFGSPTAASPTGDPDHNGRNNLTEYIVGTDPIASTPRYYVNPATGNDLYDGLAPAWDQKHGPKATIQAAIDTSHPYEGIIILAPNTYRGPGNRDVDFSGKAITVRSTDPCDPLVLATTIIDCQGDPCDPHHGFRFISGEGPDSVLTGLTITNGYAPHVSVEGILWYPLGGAIACVDSSPVIRRCRLAGNTAGYPGGGGIGLWNSAALISYCTIEDNTLYDGNGGGIACNSNTTAHIAHCDINHNTVAHWSGGGISCVDSSPEIRSCTISHNQAPDNSGGGIIFINTDSAVLSSCNITHNTSGNSGGGIYSSNSHPTIEYCAVFQNTSAAGGAGIHCQNNSSPTLTECGFNSNFGPGIYLFNSAPLLEGCTVSFNSGNGILCYNSSPNLNNCSITDHSVDSANGAGMDCYQSSPTLNYCTFQNNSITNGNGGALNFNQGAPSLYHCQIIGNTADSGGGIYACGMSASSLIDLIMSDCTIRDNVALSSSGGGLRCYFGTLEFNRCQINGNRSTQSTGGGLDLYQVTATLNDTLLSGNRLENTSVYGAGIACFQGNLTLHNCTLSDNLASQDNCFGGGLASLMDTSVAISNSIFFGNNAPMGKQIYQSGPSFTISYSDISQGPLDVIQAGTITWQAGNLNTVPWFVQTGFWNDNGTPADLTDDYWVPGSYQLRSFSPCIDAANGSVASLADLEGNPRHDDPGMPNTGTGVPNYVDIGAYERQGASVPNQGTLNIDTSGAPTKGEVFVNGISWGSAPQIRSVSVGTYTITFGALAGYYTPAPQQVTVGEDETEVITGVYTAIVGTLAIYTTGAPTQGEVFVNGISWGTAPQSRQLPVGTYTVSFGAIEDYITPRNQPAEVSENKTTSLTGTYIEEPKLGTISIQTEPISAQVFVDDISWGTTPPPREVEIGTYTVSFADVEGYITPPPQQKEVFENQTTTFMGTYVLATGTLSIDAIDITGTPLQAEVFVNGLSWGTAPQSDTIVVGNHNVTFGEVQGYVTPSAQKITIQLNQTENVIGEYLPATGTLSIDTDGASQKGEVFVNGNSWGTAPRSQVMDVGTYTISFGYQPGYKTPPDIKATVEKDQTTSKTGHYSPATGTLSIAATDIDGAPVIGEVFVNGSSWGIAPQSRELELGTYTVSFGAIDDYITPDDQDANVLENETTNVTGIYIAEPITGILKVDTSPVKGEIFLDGSYKGVAPQNLEVEVGEHTVSFSDMVDYTTPAPQQVTILENKLASISGSYVPVTPAAVMRISSMMVLAGQTRGSTDMCMISGNILPADLPLVKDPLNDLTDITLGITFTDATGVYGLAPEPLNPAQIRNIANIILLYINSGGSGGISLFMLNLSSGSFTLQARNINLSGLRIPVAVDLRIGTYHGIGPASDNIADYLAMGLDDQQARELAKKIRPLPFQLLKGTTNALQVDTFSYSNGAKPGTGNIRLMGKIALEQMVDLSNVDVTFRSGTEVLLEIEAGKFQRSFGNSYRYMKLPSSQDPALILITMDLDRCSFSLMAYGLDMDPPTGTVLFGIEFTGFNEAVSLNFD